MGYELLKKLFKKKTIFISMVLASPASFAQSPVHIQEHIRLPKDSAETEALISSLNRFLIAAAEDNERNPYVLESQRLETFVLLDEFKDVENSIGDKQDHFYQPYLTNVAQIENGQYLVQLAYVGIKGEESLLHAGFQLIAYKKDEGFVFASPLKRNTAFWQTLTKGNNSFHYRKDINTKNVEEYAALTSTFDAKLGKEEKFSEMFCVSSMAEALQLIGVDYKLDYNGMSGGLLYVISGNRKLMVLGNDNEQFDHFDPHDLWHERLSLVISRRNTNKPVDEGCAYSYGGSWGYSWEEIYAVFKKEIASNKKTDWAALKEEPVYFKTGKYNNSADYIVNALLVQKIEKEHGFAGVWELLTIGPAEKGHARYFEVLEKLTGINRKNYNKKVWELIEKAG